jgi:glycerol uptake facilitator protein
MLFGVCRFHGTDQHLRVLLRSHPFANSESPGSGAALRLSPAGDSRRVSGKDLQASQLPEDAWNGGRETRGELDDLRFAGEADERTQFESGLPPGLRGGRPGISERSRPPSEIALQAGGSQSPLLFAAADKKEASCNAANSVGSIQMSTRPLWRSSVPREITGELIGTFLLVFFGCGSVATAVLTGAQVGIFQVAIVWGIGIALAIQLTAALSGAHLNPAVTLALVASRKLPWGKTFHYLLAQFVGAFLAAATLHLIFAGALQEFETAKGIVRGAPGSEASAMVFAEFFPNPGWKSLGVTTAVSQTRAFVIESIGTAILMMAILGVTDPRNTGKSSSHAPWVIGLTVTILISLLGPLTMAAFNPARDLAPRIYAALVGWGDWPFRANGWGWLTVYVAAPIIGAQLGALIHRHFLSPGYELSQTPPSHRTAL